MNTKAIRERVNKASPGTWKAIGIPGAMQILDGESTFLSGTEENVDFIINARRDIPELLDEVERLEKALRFYANQDNWKAQERLMLAPKASLIIEDRGNIARAALNLPEIMNGKYIEV